jgi:branched-chain amino acid aminotransferase
MFSSVHGGIVTDPALMTVPLDDHLVHRGDGVFEVMKCLDGGIYNLSAHLRRMASSAASVNMDISSILPAIPEVVVETVRAGGERNAAVHVYVSRGPGSLSANPCECIGHQLYVMAARLRPPFMQVHPEGATGRRSSIPPKPPFFARIKSCNYLPNALMKMEAVRLGVDFVVAFDEKGRMGEGGTENAGIVTADERLVFPATDAVLAGTTMLRAISFSEQLVREGTLKSAGFGDVFMEDVLAAREMLVVGTTWNVAAAVRFEGSAIGSGKPGPVQRRLDSMLLSDMLTSPELRTFVFASGIV